MKIKSRGLLSAILAILCVVTLALGVSFIMPKAEKISADASTVTGAVPSVDRNYIDKGVSNYMEVIYNADSFAVRDIAANSSVGIANIMFKVELSVPAYTEYKVDYTMEAYIKLKTGLTSSDKIGAIATLWRCDSSGSKLGSAVFQANMSNKYLLDDSAEDRGTVSNLVFTNNDSSPKLFEVYFWYTFQTTMKTASARVNSGVYILDYSVTSTDITPPQTTDNDTVTYDGDSHTINFTYAGEVNSTDLDGVTHAYNTGYKNITMTVEAKDFDGNTIAYICNPSPMAATSACSGSITGTNAGVYKVIFKLNNSLEWVGGGTEKIIQLTINKANPTVNPIVEEDTWYTSHELIKDIGLSISESSTPGTISWDEGQTLKAGANKYAWTYTPADTKNYSTKTGTESITVIGIEIDHITVKFAQGTTKFYTSNELDDLKAKLGVFKIYTDGSEEVVAAENYELSGDISTAGRAAITVTYTSTVQEKPALEEFYGSFDVEITEVQLKSITATFNPAGEIYQSNSLDDLKDSLTVTGTYNDGSTSQITDYTLSTAGGGLGLGNVTVTVHPDEDSSITTMFNVNVVADPIVTVLKIPEVNDLTYTGETFEVLSELQNLTSTEVATYLDVSGTISGKNAGEYTVKFKIKDSLLGSVVWENQTATPARYGLTARLTSAQLSADGTTVELTWKILKAKVAAVWDVENSIWVPVASQLAETTESNFLTQVYTNSDGKEFTNRDNLAGGRTYQVTARINPLNSNNIELDESTQALMESGSETYTYTPVHVPTIWEKIVQFLKANWLWIVIAVAALILLIIIIAVAVKRRKTKEERAEKKAAEKERREEEKRRKEEERQRREEERRLQKEKLDAERELAKAKQEAELEKIRAQAGIGMAGAGMASMAVQQPVQAAQPQNDTNAQMLAEMRAQLAELRAENKAAQTQMMQLPQSQMSMPPMPQYAQQPMQSDFVKMFYESEIFRLRQELQSRGGSSGSPSNEDARLLLAEERARTAESRLAEERARAVEEKSYRSMEERAMLAEERYIRGGGAVPAPINQPVQSQSYNSDINPNFIGAIIASALRNSGVSPAVSASAQINAEPQVVEEKTVPSTPTMYPSDAVITTTTTVDTTKGKPVSRTRAQNENFDVDGFYDNADY